MQAIIQAITQQAIEAARAAVRAMTQVAVLAESSIRKNTMGTGPKAGGEKLRQPKLNRSAQNKYDQLKNFKMKERNIFMTNNYDIADIGKVLIIKKRLGKEGLQCIETLTTEDEEA